MLFSSTILLQTQTPALYEQYAVVVGEVPWDIGFVKRHRTFLRSIAPFGLLFYTCLWTVKLSLLLFFRRVVGLQARAHKTWWYCILVVTCLTWMGCIVANDWGCSSNSFADLTCRSYITTIVLC
jgi:lysylphosphatidylglycerol synthetase-like protein (DUF2156 family)